MAKLPVRACVLMTVITSVILTSMLCYLSLTTPPPAPHMTSPRSTGSAALQNSPTARAAHVAKTMDDHRPLKNPFVARRKSSADEADGLPSAIGASSLEKEKVFPTVNFLPFGKQKRILVTGGAGFVGSHLVDLLMTQGHAVTVVDNFYTGSRRNVEHWIGHSNFELIHHDVVNPLLIEVDQIYSLASPASPPHYMANPTKTIKANVLGTMNMLGLAKRTGARFLLASTSEVYGDPEEHPQNEEYWGHVNPIGPRACYDESKRVAETLTYAYAQRDGVEVRVARIFNTFGPRMHMADGRVVSNLIQQALQGKPMTVFGSGNQTRSFQYVSDLVEGLERLMNSNCTKPVNVGNPEEHTVLDLAQTLQRLLNSSSRIAIMPIPKDDPRRRRPDISRAKECMGWQPRVPMMEGIKKTVEYFRRELQHNMDGSPNVYPPENYHR